MKTINKKGSSCLVLKGEGQYSDIEEKEYDDYEDSSDEEGNGYAFLQHDVVCSIQDEAAIPKGWILSDSQSTDDFFQIQDCYTTYVMQKGTLYCTAMLGSQLLPRKVN